MSNYSLPELLQIWEEASALMEAESARLDLTDYDLVLAAMKNLGLICIEYNDFKDEKPINYKIAVFNRVFTFDLDKKFVI